jgi:hypothetical protein
MKHSEPTFTLDQLESSFWRAVSVYDDNLGLESDELDSKLSKAFERLKTDFLNEQKG